MTRACPSGARGAPRRALPADAWGRDPRPARPRASGPPRRSGPRRRTRPPPRSPRHRAPRATWSQSPERRPRRRRRAHCQAHLRYPRMSAPTRASAGGTGRPWTTRRAATAFGRRCRSHPSVGRIPPCHLRPVARRGPPDGSPAGAHRCSFPDCGPRPSC